MRKIFSVVSVETFLNFSFFVVVVVVVLLLISLELLNLDGHVSIWNENSVVWKKLRFNSDLNIDNNKIPFLDVLLNSSDNCYFFLTSLIEKTSGYYYLPNYNNKSTHTDTNRPL